MKKAYKCCECDEIIADSFLTAKDAIALNRKLLNRQATSCFCADCLIDYLDADEQDLIDKVEQFKSEGCTLF